MCSTSHAVSARNGFVWTLTGSNVVHSHALLCCMRLKGHHFAFYAALMCFITSRAHGSFIENDSIPAVNQRVVDFVMGQVGKKVGRGECWDLAAEALNSAGAKWDGLYAFGVVVNWKTTEILPGDIVQFAEVEVRHQEGDAIRTERYGKHTAVVVAVKGRGNYELAHQNVEPVGRKVGVAPLNMADVRSGKLVFFRPQE